MPEIGQRSVLRTETYAIAEKPQCENLSYLSGPFAKPGGWTIYCVAAILKELTRSPPSVAGVVNSDKRAKFSAETGALGHFY